MYIIQRRMSHTEQRGTDYIEKVTQVDQNTTPAV